MGLTFAISGDSFAQYDQSGNEMNSTFVTMKLSFALFPSTLIGTLPTALALAGSGVITGPQAALAVMLSNASGERWTCP